MIQSDLLAGVAHGFTGVEDGDHRPGVDATAGPRLVAMLGGEGPLRRVTQVHGAGVVHVAAFSPETEADAIVSAVPGVVISVRVADCVPILLAAPRVVAAVHAGWRGTAADITRAALRAVCSVAGCAPASVRAAIGPAICGRCYQVGSEVLEGVSRVAAGASWVGAGSHVDLAEANASILRAEGVRVEVLGLCTRCGPGFWSYRRDGATGGRQVGAIRL